jgi:hypothetical protein
MRPVSLSEEKASAHSGDPYLAPRRNCSPRELLGILRIRRQTVQCKEIWNSKRDGALGIAGDPYEFKKELIGK